MKKRLIDFLNKKNQGSTVLEFLVVFILLMVFLIFIVDLGLFFRQVYLVQTVSDEVLATLQASYVCTNAERVHPILSRTVGKYYSVNATFNGGAFENGFYNHYTSDRKYTFVISCRKSSIPSSVGFSYKYKGLFIFHSGKVISSYYSTNTSYF